ncbi:bifunctional chorismate mutase/prephenate dehydrogenase [Actinobacillus equuli]|nr:bifunctional chorismate mutase/prephenate dehydrogenase [Actinobacillus equuli]
MIVGGKGKLGGLFARFLELSGYQVETLGSKDWDNAQQILSSSDLVIVCVPINKTLDTIERLQPFLTENMILADLTSVKAQPLEKMLEIHSGPVVGLHPMFGPDIASMAKQLVACCHGRFSEKYEWLIEQIKIWGAKLK